jgi:nucleotide-binding universal stress UspA family protein
VLIRAVISIIKVQIKKMLVPIDGSDWSLYAAKHAVKLAKD